MEIKAARRLAAATDTKGAIKYIKSVISKYVEVKSMRVIGETGNEIGVKCRGPVGDVEFSLYLANKRQLYIDFFNTQGLEPRAPDIDNSISDFKMSKRRSVEKSLRPYAKGLDRAARETDAYAQKVTQVKEWVEALTQALDELKSNMD